VTRNVLLSLLVLVGCPEPAPECVDNGQCAIGEACIQETCQAVQCLDSSSCGLGEFCKKPEYACTSGCEADTDCLAGERCNKNRNECVEYDCRSTDLDCGLGEICNDDGQCETAPGKHCAPCEDYIFGTGCGTNGTCYPFDDAYTENYCIVGCNGPSDDSCPRGYECVDLWGMGDYECFAWCPTLAELSN
jgi:hypothetical protein